MIQKGIKFTHNETEDISQVEDQLHSQNHLHLHHEKKLMPRLQPINASLEMKRHTQLLTRKEPKIQRKINWKASREKLHGPGHKIPQAERFKKDSMIQGSNFSFHYDLRQDIKKKGVTFARSLRKELFLREMTPSATDYNKRRYLQNDEGERWSSNKRRSIYGSTGKKEHIPGGTFYKFHNYEDLYYPQISKMSYNDRNLKLKKKERDDWENGSKSSRY